MKEIFQKLADQLIVDIGDVNWIKSILSIVRLEGSVRFSAVYIDNYDNSHNVDVNFGFRQAQLVHELYRITQEDALIHINWNRAEFTLYPTGKVEIEYIWDQELCDQVYNN